MVTIKTTHIAKENISKYGSVVLSPRNSPTAQAREFKFWSDLACYTVHGETEIGICTVYRQPAMEVNAVERHSLTPEILIPIDGSFILPLLKEGVTDDQMEAFRVDVGEAVVINPGVWHGACLPAKGKQASYFVVFRRRTPQEDVVKKRIQAISIR
ncbi:MAG TPA: ureidoglycolate lyase [Bacteroidota bacterium]